MKYKHIVVFGFPRSGTTLLYCMLQGSVVGYRFYPAEVTANQAARRHPGVDKITKRPMDIKNVKLYSRTIPDIGFILCVRDPRSILVSHVRGAFKVNWNYSTHMTHSTGQAIEGKNEGLVDRHNFAVETLEYSPFICKYEELVTDPETMQQNIGEHFGLEYKDSFRNFNKHPISGRMSARLNRIRPVSTDRIMSWKDYPERIYEQFDACRKLFRIVKYWGYEEDNRWFREMYK